jgi:hypothetical protein
MASKKKSSGTKKSTAKTGAPAKKRTLGKAAPPARKRTATLPTVTDGAGNVQPLNRPVGLPDTPLVTRPATPQS